MFCGPQVLLEGIKLVDPIYWNLHIMQSDQVCHLQAMLSRTADVKLIESRVQMRLARA